MGRQNITAHKVCHEIFQLLHHVSSLWACPYVSHANINPEQQEDCQN